MIETYEPMVAVLLVSIVVVGMACVILGINFFLGPKRPTNIKGIPYESGLDPISQPRHRFSVKFYMTAILFLVFDLEVVFIYPWALRFRSWIADPAFGPVAFWSMMVFLAVLTLGLVYEVKRGAMNWE